MHNSFASAHVDSAWHALMHRIVANGVSRPDRTGTGTRALFGTQLRLIGNPFDPFFPAVTTKQLHTGQMWAELAAFLQGAESLQTFHALGCKIWDTNALDPRWVADGARFEGDVGRIYGVQWRGWRSVVANGAFRTTDQLSQLLLGLKSNPYGRRHVVTALNPGELDQMCLPPCHVMFQCFVEPPRTRMQGSSPTVLLESRSILHLRVDMRSVDVFLGLPFDIASYATLQHLIAREAGMDVGDLLFQMGDTHLYDNHADQVAEVLSREVSRTMPRLLLDPEATVDNFVPSHAQLVGYTHAGSVAAPMNN